MSAAPVPGAVVFTCLLACERASEGKGKGEGTDQALLDFAVHVTSGEPVVAKLRSAVEVDVCDDSHVALAPLAAAVRHLALEQLEGIQPQFLLLAFERLAEDCAALVLHEREVAVRLALDHFLHHAQEVDGCEEVAPGEDGDGGWRRRGDGVLGGRVGRRRGGLVVLVVVVFGDRGRTGFV